MALLHLGALIYSFELLSKERANALFLLPLSTALCRQHYILALFCAVGVSLFLLFVIFLGVDAAALLAIEGSIHPSLLWQLFLYLLSALILGGIVLTLALFVSIPNATIYAILLFFIGSSLDEMLLFLQSQDAGTIGSMLYYLLPNFSFFDFLSFVGNRAFVDAFAFYIFPPLYALVLLLILITVSMLRFKNRKLGIGG